MALDIDLASFSFDTSEIVAGAALIKKNIDELKAAQKELAKNNDTSSEAFVQNAADLKTLNGYYNEHVKYLSEATKGAFDAATREAQLELVLDQEATTIKELRDQNKQLNKLRNDTNVLTEEGQAELKVLNAQLDANNALIKENVDQYTQQKIGIGDYAGGIKAALAEMNPFNTSIFIFIENAKEAGGVLPFLSRGLKSVTSGIVAITRASLAFIATPIGAVIAAIGLVLGAVIGYLKSTQAGMDAVTKVTRPLAAIFESLIGVLQQVGKWLFEAFSNPKKTITDIYNFVKDRVIRTFENLYDIMVGIATLDFEQAKKGFNGLADQAKENVEALKNAGKQVGEFFTEAIEKGLELDRLEKELEQTRINNTTELGKQAEVFKAQNKIAEDTNKTLDERQAAVQESIKAAERINALKQQELQLEIDILKNKQSRNDTSREEELALAELIARQNELNAQELEMTTTQQNKLNTIRREAQSKANAAASKAVDQRLKTEADKIALFEQQQNDGRAKTLQQELDIDRMISEMKLKSLDNQLKAQKISQEQYAREVLAISQDLARQEAEIKVAVASKEIEAYRKSFEQQQEERRFLSEKVLQDKTNELNALLAKEKEFARIQLEQGVIDQDKYDAAVNEAKEANRLAIAEVTKEREDVEKQEAEELRTLAFEAELERLLEEGATRFEIQQAQTQEQFKIQKQALDDSLKNQQISQELYDARLSKLTKDRTDAEIENEKALSEEKFKLATDLFDAAASFIDKDSKAGKAIALAKAGINMYQGISAGVALGFPAAIPAVAFASATGLKAIKDITSTKIPSAKGSGSVGGGGGSFSANLATNLSGQGVALNPSNNSTVQDQVQNQADLSNMTEQIAGAVQQGAMQGTQQGSQEGITNLSANRQIMEQSSF